MTSFISWMDNIRNFLKPVYLFLYRGSAFLVITGGLLFLLGWGFVILFFLFNHSWVSPTYVSLTSKEALTFAAGYQTAQQNYYTLMVTHNQAVREFQIAKTTHENMVDLGQVSLDYNRTLKSAAKVKGPQIAENVEVSKHFDQVKQQLYRDRLLGLITSTDLVSGLASVQQFQTNTVNDGVAWATTNLTTLTGEVQLTAQSMQSASDVATKRDIIIASELSVSTAKQVLDAFNESIYKKAFEGRGMTTVFLAYDNRSHARDGAPIYDCRLMLVVCRQVGTIVHVYNDEDTIEFPLFNVKLSRTMRGVFAEVRFTDSEAKYDDILFAGYKPLLF